jgi:hypothetical protein
MNEPTDSVAKKSVKRKELPTKEFLNECFSYDPETGKLIWKTRPLHHFPNSWRMNATNARMAGKEAGTRVKCHRTGNPKCVDVGFWKVAKYKAHIIIHLLMGIEIPDGLEVDHRDGNPWNNKWENLRIGTHQQNLCNLAAPRDKINGLPIGISICRDSKKNPFRSQICFKGKIYLLGLHPTVELAAAARRAAEIRFFGDLADGRRGS